MSTKGPGEQLLNLQCLKIAENLKPGRVPGAKIAPETLETGRSLLALAFEINAKGVFP